MDQSDSSNAIHIEGGEWAPPIAIEGSPLAQEASSHSEWTLCHQLKLNSFKLYITHIKNPFLCTSSMMTNSFIVSGFLLPSRAEC